MSKKLFNWMLMAAVVLGLGMSVTSCKDDDDDDKKTEEQKAQEAQEKADRFWDVMTQLAGVNAYTPDYEGKTFEPVIGLPDDGNPMVRIVNTGDMATAAKRFADLVSVGSIDEGTSSYEWKDDQVGTMTYRKTNNGQSWAVVDVNIKAMPRLQQIIYRSAEQSGQNGSFDGTAYYRFGDVIKRSYIDESDDYRGKDEYWICVRPAVGAAGKEDTHWISICRPPKKNIWTYTTKDGERTFGLPTGIGKNEEHMQNFAELLYAILYPHEWAKNITSNERTPHPKMWWDFKPERYKWNNEWFFQRVCNAWDLRNYEGGKDLWSVLFENALTKEEFKKDFEQYGLHLLYKGYSWWPSVSWNLTLYEAVFKNGQGKNANMHDLTYREVKGSVQEMVKPFNLNDPNYNKAPYLANEDFFGEFAMHFVIRHATGKELAGFKPSVYKSLANETNGIEDIYTYNKAYNIKPDEDTYPEEATEEMITEVKELDAPELGCIIGANGKFYKNVTFAKNLNNGKEPIGIVCCLNGKKRVETGTSYNALALSLKTTPSTTWSGGQYDCNVPLIEQFNEFSKQLNGLALTKKYVEGCGQGHEHDAAKNSYFPVIDNNNDFSYAFMPSTGQWVLVFKSLGMTWSEQRGHDTDDGSMTAEQQIQEQNLVDDFYKEAGLNAENYKSTYWTVQKNNEMLIYTFSFNYWTMTNEPYRALYFNSNPTLPFIAFKYDGGATED